MNFVLKQIANPNQYTTEVMGSPSFVSSGRSGVQSCVKFVDIEVYMIQCGVGSVLVRER